MIIIVFYVDIMREFFDWSEFETAKSSTVSFRVFSFQIATSFCLEQWNFRCHSKKNQARRIFFKLKSDSAYLIMSTLCQWTEAYIFSSQASTVYIINLPALPAQENCHLRKAPSWLRPEKLEQLTTRSNR